MSGTTTTGAGAAGGSAPSGASGDGVGASSASGAAGGAASTDAPWFSSLKDEKLRGWVENKAYASPEVALAAHRSLEDYFGVPKERLLKLPESRELESLIGNGVLDQLGRPAKPTEYGFLKGEAPAGIDPELRAEVASWYHEAGLTDSQAAALERIATTKLSARETATAERAQLEREQANERQVAALDDRWGAKKEANYTAAKAGRAALVGEDGKPMLTDERMDKLQEALGYDVAAELLAFIGSKMQEPPPRGPDTGAGFGAEMPRTPAAAEQRLDALSKSPEFMDRLRSPDPVVQMKAQSEWNALNAYALGMKPAR